jgi:aminoglycoside phosphotransferase (APT) family kinase protein
MEQIFTDLLNAYGLNTGSARIKTIGSGYIHDTYLVDRSGSDDPPLVLQRMNQTVFKDIGQLMHNFELITTHIAYKNRKAGKDPAKSGLLPVEAEEGRSWIGNEDSGYWRMFWFIENQVTYEVAETGPIAYEGGRAIAHFQSLLTDMDSDSIGDAIPHFHNLGKRMQQFEDAIAGADSQRLKKAGELIGFTRDHFPLIMSLYDLSEQKNFARRLTHNDTKFNNILFNKDGTANCMIDLDTVMNGYSWFDFGDALRTCAGTAPEDEGDPSRIGFRMEIFREFARGFLSEAHGFLAESEITELHKAPKAFTFMQGLRFLTDYLNGDIYYKAESEEDNYRRAVAQYTMMQRMKERESEMAAIIEQAAAARPGNF